QEDSTSGDTSGGDSRSCGSSVFNDHVRTGHGEAALRRVQRSPLLVPHGPVTAVRGKEPSVAGQTVPAILLLRLLDRAGLSLSGPTGLLRGGLDGLLHVPLNVDVHRAQFSFRLFVAASQAACSGRM